MANVQRTSSGRWECRWSWYVPDPETGRMRRQEQRKTFTRKVDADAHRRSVEDRAANQQSVDQNPGKQPLRVWAERWFRSLEGKKKASTLRGYRRVLDATVLPRLGHRPVAGITTYDVEQFIDYLTSTGKSAPTVKRHYGALRSSLNYAARHRAIPVNPCVGAELPADHRTDPAPIRALSPQQVETLARVLDVEPPYGLMIRFMAYTGLRAGEVAGLNIGDVGIMRRRVNVTRTRTKIKGGWELSTPKTNKQRVVPLPKWLAEDLAAYLAQHPYGPNGHANPDHPLWPGRTANEAARFQHATGSIDYSKPWERDAFYKRQFRPALEAAGLPMIRLHDLRHTAASIMLTNGIPRFEVAKYLGHSVQVLEAIYAHLIDDGTDYMSKLDRPTAKGTA